LGDQHFKSMTQPGRRGVQDNAALGGRRHWRVRTVVIVAATFLTVLALLTAGFSFDPLSNWWRQLSIASGLSGTAPQHDYQRPLNGAVLVAPPAPTGNDSSVSPTPQRLVLVAARPGRNANEGTAQLGVDPSSPQTYVAGALLANGARLSEIYSDHVVLEKDGRTVRLGIAASPDGDPAAAGALLTVGGAQAARGVAPTPSSDGLTDYLRPSPVFEGSSLVGYQVYAGSHADTFAQLGLRDGDVIRAVDGAPVTDASTAIEQLESLTQGRAITASVLRAGQLVTISLDGAVITGSQARALAANSADSQGNKTN
jgi:hypothetical protein